MKSIPTLPFDLAGHHLREELMFDGRRVVISVRELSQPFYSVRIKVPHLGTLTLQLHCSYARGAGLAHARVR